jgi:predicted PurR-regulated permease PerM
MDEPERSGADREPAPGAPTPETPPPEAPPPEGPPDVSPPEPPSEAPPSTEWVAALPPPPFVDPASMATEPRFRALSPRVAVLIAAAIVVGILLWMARDAVRPFIVGLLLVYLLDPPVRWLVRRGLRRTLAILLVYGVAIVAFIEIAYITLTPLIDELGRFLEDLPGLADQLQAQLDRLSEIYARLQLPLAVREWIDALIGGAGQGGTGAPQIDFTVLLPVLTGAGSLIGAIFGYVLLPVWIFYLLKDRVALTETFDRSLPPAWRFDVWAVLRIARRVFGQWVRGQLVLGVAVGVFTFIGLLALSRFVDPVFGRYAVLLSVTAGILELLPIVGPILSAIPAVLLAATAGLEPVIAALLLYTLVQQVENNLLVPKIQGDAVELHPAAVIFAIIIGGSLAGLLGAILALPVTAAARDVVRYLFRRLSPDASEAVAVSIAGLGLETHPGVPAAANALSSDEPIA